METKIERNENGHWLPGQSGNPQLKNRERLFYSALRRAIAQDDSKRLRGAAEKLLDLAAAGESWAVRELRDTLDGRPAQVIAGDEDSPLRAVYKVELVALGNSEG